MSCSVLLASTWDSFEALKFDATDDIFEVAKGPRGIKIGPQRPLSWRPLEVLLEASWPNMRPK